jgi:hypothetical protein
MGKVQNNRRTKLLPKIILGQSFFALVITAIALGVIFYAQGERFDFKHLRIIKTGVLTIDYLPDDASVYLSGKLVAGGGNVVENITPGTYSVRISKPGYVTWNKTLRVESHSVNNFKKVFLVREKIESSELVDQSKISLLDSPIDVLASNASDSLIFNDYEIWVGTKLIARFSSKVNRAIWYPDLAHIVYQQGNEIRIIDLNGNYDTLLVTLTQANSTKFAIGNHGTELYYLDGGKYKLARIR